MPIDYNKYPDNWKTEIRPRILERADNKCEFCGVENYKVIFRCYDAFDETKKELYQDSDGNLYDAADSKLIDNNSFNWDLLPLGKDTAIKVILTVAHLDHDLSHNEDKNLKALCQRCHLRYDAKHKAQKRKEKNQYKLEI